MYPDPRQHPEISETAEYGVALRLKDAVLADEFDDYLSEECFVLFTLARHENSFIFYFGQASERSKVLAVFEKFLSQNQR
jgi:spermidine synthase